MLVLCIFQENDLLEKLVFPEMKYFSSSIFFARVVLFLDFSNIPYAEN